MENVLLQPLLQAGLLEIGDSDERLENIEKSIIELEGKLKKQHSLLPYYTLTALDPYISSDEPVLSEVEKIITSHWKALRAKFSETPIPIIRAVMLHALYNIGINDAKIARIIYLTGTNFYPVAKLGREKKVVEKLMTDLGEIAEKHAIKEWALPEEQIKFNVENLSIPALELSEIEIDGDELKKSLHFAIKNHSSGHGSQHGGNTEWGTHFATNSSQGIKSAIESGLNEISEAISTASIEQAINNYFSNIKQSIEELMKSSLNSLKNVERRSNLLLWKETLYSSYLKTSYRDINTALQPIVMAEDLYQQLPNIVPISVDYLLRETVRQLNNKAEEKMPISEFLSMLSTEENKVTLKEYLPEKGVIGKRMSITNFISHLASDKIQISDLKKCTGIDGNDQFSFSDVTVMILHDLMAEHLTQKSK